LRCRLSGGRLGQTGNWSVILIHQSNFDQWCLPTGKVALRKIFIESRICNQNVILDPGQRLILVECAILNVDILNISLEING